MLLADTTWCLAELEQCEDMILKSSKLKYSGTADLYWIYAALFNWYY